MKTTIEIDLNDPDQKAKLELFLKLDNISSFFWDLEQNIFRPARKHGYPESLVLNELIKNEAVVEAIGILEQLYYNYKKEHGLDFEL